MRQAILGLSIFVGLQIVYVLVLFGLTRWEGRQLDRPTAEPAPKETGTPQPVPIRTSDEDLPLSA